jgi:hypothetical protein
MAWRSVASTLDAVQDWLAHLVVKFNISICSLDTSFAYNVLIEFLAVEDLVNVPAEVSPPTVRFAHRWSPGSSWG